MTEVPMVYGRSLGFSEPNFFGVSLLYHTITILDLEYKIRADCYHAVDATAQLTTNILVSW